MNRTRLLIPVLAATLLLAGCAGDTDAGTDSETESKPTPSAVEEPTTIETVWEEVDCAEDDIMGSGGMIQDAEAPVTRTATCSPFGGDELAFFWELEDEEAARAWFATGELEVGATDAVYIDGGVIMLATDANTASEFAKLYEPPT